jgi:LysM repeat protein
MRKKANRSPARFLAPLALVGVVIVFIMVVAGSGGGSGNDGTNTAAGSKTSTGQTTTVKTKKRTYTVKSGDSLGLIAERTGIPVETLQQLNPELDPQALISGQKIQLR